MTSSQPVPNSNADALAQAIVAWLSSPQAYSEHPSHIEHIETHISHVFLTDRQAYKLKKPVRYDFLDFSTPQIRQRVCRGELELNRRLAGDVYETVLPITRDDDGAFHFEGSGTTVDWILRMRRLPADRMLDEVVRRGALGEADIDRLASFLARYYTSAEPVSLSPNEYRTVITNHVRGNLSALAAARLAHDSARVRRIHAAQLRLLCSRPEIFSQRVAAGKIIDGHGDLRPEHVCLLDPPVIFDCIEFSADLRRIDVLDELCFLAMECDLLGVPRVGERVLAAYEARSNDRPPPGLIAFYKTYRACVRAKVAALRAQQQSGQEQAESESLMRSYLDLSDSYLRAVDTRPLLVLVTGLMGTGKSTLARQLSDALSATWIRTDAVRDELLPHGSQAAAFNAGRYEPQQRSAVYQEVLARAGRDLSQGVSVIVDGCYTQADPRDAVMHCGRELGADVVHFECVCPRDVALSRIGRRLQTPGTDPSEARPELYDRQAAERQLSTLSAISIDSTLPLDRQFAEACRHLANPFHRTD